MAKISDGRTSHSQKCILTCSGGYLNDPDCHVDLERMIFYYLFLGTTCLTSSTQRQPVESDEN